MLTADDIKARIESIEIPYLHQPLGSGDSIEDIVIGDNGIQIYLSLHFPAQHKVAYQLKQSVQLACPNQKVEIIIRSNVMAHALQQQVNGIKNVKNTIAVASGKGGVGKSTTCVNLALALAQEGANVGILDADIYGPNQPQMLGITDQQPELTSAQQQQQQQLKPLHSHGIQSMSIGYLLEQNDTPTIWRGPMVSKALEQLLYDSQWDDLDYLFIDLPPGTGDIQLTLSQKIPVTGAVITTTPQDIALSDARKAVRMFEKVKIPVLGVIENMSLHICSECGHEEHVFGEGGAQQMAQQYQVEHLGSLPLDQSIRANTDGGEPSVIAAPQSQIAHHYRDIALRISAKLSQYGKDRTRQFPNIVVE